MNEVTTAREGLNEVEGLIYSAIPLNESQITQLTYVFTKKLQKRIKFKVEIDESLIGGYKVNVDNIAYDYTLKQQLEQLQETLINADTESR